MMNEGLTRCKAYRGSIRSRCANPAIARNHYIRGVSNRRSKARPILGRCCPRDSEKGANVGERVETTAVARRRHGVRRSAWPTIFRLLEATADFGAIGGVHADDLAVGRPQFTRNLAVPHTIERDLVPRVPKDSGVRKPSGDAKILRGMGAGAFGTGKGNLEFSLAELNRLIGADALAAGKCEKDGDDQIFTHYALHGKQQIAAPRGRRAGYPAITAPQAFAKVSAPRASAGMPHEWRDCDPIALHSKDHEARRKNLQRAMSNIVRAALTSRSIRRCRYRSDARNRPCSDRSGRSDRTPRRHASAK